MDATSSPHPSVPSIDRRGVLRLGGLSLTLAGIVVACGGEQDTDPGRVGVVPATTAIANYPVDEAVLLRTATSLELTIVSVYEEILGRGVVDAEWTRLMEALVENHRETATALQALTIAAGGTAWVCVNPWIEERTVVPVIESIDRSVDVQRNAIDFAIALENLAAANNQSLAATMSTAEQRSTLATAAAQAGRNSATIVIRQRGNDGYVDPDPDGEVEFDADGAPLQFAVPSVFGSLAAIELIIVAPDEDGGPEDFALQIPADNAYIYNELDNAC